MKNKIIYLFLSVIYCVIFNTYLSNIIIDKCCNLIDNPLFDIVFIKNQGAAFNIFDGYKIFLITFSLIALVTIIIYVVKHIQKICSLELFFIALLLGGIFNNMTERMIFGYVRDYIKLNFIDFPVFNISDIFINIGVLGIIYIIIKDSCPTKNS